jgi:hypothetical protein
MTETAFQSATEIASRVREGEYLKYDATNWYFIPKH